MATLDTNDKIETKPVAIAYSLHMLSLLSSIPSCVKAATHL